MILQIVEATQPLIAVLQTVSFLSVAGIVFGIIWS